MTAELERLRELGTGDSRDFYLAEQARNCEALETIESLEARVASI